jgi:hypothetical protein
MGQKSSLPQPAPSVSLALMPDTPELVDTFAKLGRERKGVEWAKDGVNSPMSSSERR